MCYLFPQQLSVNIVKEQIRSYGRGSPTHSDQLDSQQCKGNTTLLIRIDKVTIQSWQAGDTVLQGCDTVFERLRYFFGAVTWQKQSYRGQRVQLSA